MNDERLSDIERRISATRENLDSTLRAIEARLEPEALVHEGLDYLRRSGVNEFVSNLGSSVKDNPLPVTFVALGMAWLMMTGKRSAGPSRLSAAADSAAGHIADGVRRAAAGVSDTAHEWRERASESGQATAEAARDMFERARDGYERIREQQPLALGAVGLAIGAAIAIALPHTHAEDELMGDASDRVADKAREAGREGIQRAERVAASAAGAVRRETTQPAGTADARCGEEPPRNAEGGRSTGDA